MNNDKTKVGSNTEVVKGQTAGQLVRMAVDFPGTSTGTGGRWMLGWLEDEIGG